MARKSKKVATKEAKVYKEVKPIEELSPEANKDIALKLLEQHLPSWNNKQTKWKEIHNGYTNFSYKVTFSDGQVVQIRLPHDGNIINRSNEYDILYNYLKANEYIFFDPKTGRTIKKWLPGEPPRKSIYTKPAFLDKLFNKIKEIHAFKLKPDNNFKPIKFDAYNQNLYRLKFHYKKKFLCLIDRIRDEKLVINHTDINPLNIIYDHSTKSIRLIDFEWAGLASDYYDYANFVRETGIKYKKINWSKYISHFSMQKFEHYLYLTSVYAYLWTFVMPQTKKMLKYRKITFKQLKKYYTATINRDKANYLVDPEQIQEQQETKEKDEE